MHAPGTLLSRRDVHYGLVDHYGIVVHAQPCTVAHIVKGPTGRIDLRVETYEQFACGLPVRAEPPERPVPPEQMWLRVKAVVQRRPTFGLLCWGREWNCETFARFVRDGVAKSKQAAGAKALLAFAGALGLAALDSRDAA